MVSCIKMMYQDINFCVECEENQIFSCAPQTEGVCQDCGSSPCLFSIFINDILVYLDIEGTHYQVINGLRIQGLICR
jgi:hypothetical protein